MPEIKDKTVNFGDLNSLDDLGIIFNSFTIDSPAPQVSMIDVPYRNGSLDITEYYGDIRYKDRNLNFTFYIPWWVPDQPGIYSRVLDKLHGKRMKIVLASDPDWYYIGRLSVGSRALTNGFWAFPITALCEPFKMNDIEKIYYVNSSTKQDYRIISSRMPTIPDITVHATSGNITLIFKGQTYAFSTGTYKNPDIIFTEGDNDFSIKGHGSIQFSYKEGRL